MNLLSLALACALNASPNFHPSQSTPEQPRGEIIYSHRLDRELRGFVSDDLRIISMDSMYGCLPEAETRALIQTLLFTFDNKYIDEARDCDDLALEFIVKLRQLFREQCEEVPLGAPVGLVDVKLCADVPEMGYNLHGGVGYHAIVIVRCLGGKWLLVDPDTKKVSEFTQHLYEGTMELRRAIF